MIEIFLRDIYEFPRKRMETVIDVAHILESLHASLQIMQVK